MTGRADRARAVLTLTRRGDVVAFTGRLPQIPSVSDRWQPGGAACEYMAADASCAGPGWCDLADVIICGRRVRPASISALLTRVLGRYPGCAVAAASAGGSACVVAARCGTMVAFTACSPPGEPGLCALACGSFVHAWLCTGRPLAGLDPPAVAVVAGRAPAGHARLAQGGAWACSFQVTGGSAPG
jgi:hypothetical protein